MYYYMNNYYIFVKTNICSVTSFVTFALNLVQKTYAEYIFPLTWKKCVNFGGFPENVRH